jgi:hypothetical protein
MGGGVEQQGVDGPPRWDQRIDKALGDRREQIERLLGTVLGKVDRGRRNPHLGPVTILLANAVERGACLGHVAHPNLGQHDAEAKVNGERVLAREIYHALTQPAASAPAEEKTLARTTKTTSKTT